MNLQQCSHPERVSRSEAEGSAVAPRFIVGATPDVLREALRSIARRALVPTVRGTVSNARQWWKDLSRRAPRSFAALRMTLLRLAALRACPE